MSGHALPYLLDLYGHVGNNFAHEDQSIDGWMEAHWCHPLRGSGMAYKALMFTDFGPEVSLLEICLTALLANPAVVTMTLLVLIVSKQLPR